MPTVRLRNINPLGQVDLPLIGRQEGGDLATLGVHGAGCLEPGEVFEVDAELAGHAPSTTTVDVLDDDDNPTGEVVELVDLGSGLLAQASNSELVTRKTKKTDKHIEADAATQGA